MRIPDLSAYSQDEAKAFIGDSLMGPAYRAFIDARGKIAGEIPIAVLPREYMESIGAKTNIVRLSAETLSAHTIKHQDITTDDYLRLQEIIENAETIIQDKLRLNTMVFMEYGDKIYTTVIKADCTGSKLYMSTLYIINRKKYAKLRSGISTRWKIIKR